MEDLLTLSILFLICFTNELYPGPITSPLITSWRDCGYFATIFFPTSVALLIPADPFLTIEETTIRTISFLRLGFGRFPDSSTCIISSVKWPHGITKESTQSYSGGVALLEEVEGEVTGERDCKGPGVMEEVSDELLDSGVWPAEKTRQQVRVRNTVMNVTAYGWGVIPTTITRAVHQCISQCVCLFCLHRPHRPSYCDQTFPG